MIDVSSSEGWLATSLRCMHLVQMVVQGRWLHDCTLLTLPCVDSGILSLFRLKNRSLECLPELLDAVRGSRKMLNTMLGDALSEGEITEVCLEMRSRSLSNKIPNPREWTSSNRLNLVMPVACSLVVGNCNVNNTSVFFFASAL